MSDSENYFADFVANRAEAASISSKTHLVTVFGDVMSQHGNSIWLGSLITALAPLGFSERLIRTSVFRLVKDEWLEAEKIGRRSYYRLTKNAMRIYEKAAKRIYSADASQWDGQWLIAIPCHVAEDKLTHLRRQLNWLGFSPLSSGVFAHPSIERKALEETIEELGVVGQVIVFTAKTLDKSANLALQKLAHERWQLTELEDAYSQFVKCYGAVRQQLLNIPISDEQSFLLRTLMIHEYRRILLKDHELPPDMLPKPWSGYIAHQLVSQIYADLAKASNRYIIQTLENSDGLLPPESVSFWSRFSNMY